MSRRIANRDVDDYTLLEPVTPTDEIDVDGVQDPDEADEED